MKEKKFLPIGTIVRVNNDSNLLMITGYFMYDDNNGIERYDYATCKYPYGTLFTKSVKGINHTDIIEIVYEGYRNNASDLLNEKLKNSVSDIKMSASSTNIFFDENGIVVTDTKEKIIEDDEYLTMLENTQITNPFISHNESESEIGEIPQESDKWPIFKNIQFDASGNVTEAEEYEDNTSIVPGIEFDENGVVMGFEEEKPQTNSSLKFDENGNVVADGADNKKGSLEIEFDENGFVTSTNEEKPATNNSLRFDENGNVVADSTDNKKESSGIEFDENGFVTSTNEEKPTANNSLRFDENGNVVADGAEGKKEPSGIEFDENGFVISFNEDKPKLGDSLKFDENGKVISDETEQNGLELDESITNIKFDEKGYVILDEKNIKLNQDEIITIDDEF